MVLHLQMAPCIEIKMSEPHTLNIAIATMQSHAQMWLKCGYHLNVMSLQINHLQFAADKFKRNIEGENTSLLVNRG